MPMEKEINIVFFGAPGAGKGTQAKKISQNLSLTHVDTGNLIREAISNKTVLGVKAKEFVETGKLVPDELVIELIKEKLLDLKVKVFKGFVLDGYPRTITQADALEKMLEELKIKLTSVINIKVDKILLIPRLSSRRLCANKTCGEIYNLITSPPKVINKCDRCNSDLYQRKDDTEEAVKQRLSEYNNKTAPLEQYYRNQKKLIDINGALSPDEVYNEIINKVTGNNSCTLH